MMQCLTLLTFSFSSLTVDSWCENYCRPKKKTPQDECFPLRWMPEKNNNLKYLECVWHWKWYSLIRQTNQRAADGAFFLWNISTLNSSASTRSTLFPPHFARHEKKFLIANNNINSRIKPATIKCWRSQISRACFNFSFFLYCAPTAGNILSLNSGISRNVRILFQHRLVIHSLA